MSKETITIHWDNRPTYNRFKVALDVQDAGNLRALAREFVKVVDTAMEATGSTEKTWDDPAVVLFVNKFESLCRSEARFSAAYAACQEQLLPFAANVDNIGKIGNYATLEEAQRNVRETIEKSGRADEHGFVLHNGELVWEINEVDLKVQNEGSIFILTPCTECGREWIKEHIPEDAIRWGQESVVIEHRYIENIVQGAINDGLEVQ